MQEESPRVLCRVRTSNDVFMYTCQRCAWTLRFEGDDIAAGQAAFDAQRCEDFTRDDAV